MYVHMPLSRLDGRVAGRVKDLEELPQATTVGIVHASVFRFV